MGLSRRGRESALRLDPSPLSEASSMTIIPASVAAVAAAPLPATPASLNKAAAIASAAQHLLPHLQRGQCVDAPILRTAMESAFDASDADGTWDWKMAYDACEAATVLFLRKFGPAMRARADSPVAMLPMLAKIAGLLPTHTRRSEESEALQQFSTPMVLGFAASTAAAITPADVVLEPSAGTGLLAVLAELSGASLALNEFAETRAGLLTLLFPGIAVTRFDAAHINDHLDTAIKPSVVLMNPPFSAVANVDRRMGDAALRHIASALARLPEGGRLVAITGANCSPDNPVWTDDFIRLQERGRVVFTAAIAGPVFAKHGTTIETRLTVIDRLPAGDATVFPSPLGVAPDVATLLGWVAEYVPARLPIAMPVAALPNARPGIPQTVRAYAMRPSGTAAPTADPAGEDPYVGAMFHLSRTLLCLGHLDEARLRRDEALAEAQRLSPFMRAFALRQAWYGDWAIEGASFAETMLLSAKEVVAVSNEHGFRDPLAIGNIMRGWCLGNLGQAAEGIPLLLQGLTVCRAGGRNLMIPFFLMTLAEAYGTAAQPQEGLDRLAEAAKLVEATHERWAEAEIHRLRGTVFLSMNEHAAAEDSYRRALEVAQRQSAKFWELRAALGLARLWRDQGKRTEARDLLSPIYGWFTEGLDTRDLKEAKALLAELAQ